ncbi:MAG: hypothetical protein K2P99_03560, partial [Burkholderiales bacterium]|nr:hypothetical protein [Burkholderiales bacterium]
VTNRYNFADGNPISNIDPSGHMSGMVIASYALTAIGVFASIASLGGAAGVVSMAVNIAIAAAGVGLAVAQIIDDKQECGSVPLEDWVTLGFSLAVAIPVVIFNVKGLASIARMEVDAAGGVQRLPGYYEASYGPPSSYNDDLPPSYNDDLPPSYNDDLPPSYNDDFPPRYRSPSSATLYSYSEFPQQPLEERVGNYSSTFREYLDRLFEERGPLLQNGLTNPEGFVEGEGWVRPNNQLRRFGGYTPGGILSRMLHGRGGLTMVQ